MSPGQWESDRQRVAAYVERRRRERLALRDAIFRRINAHVSFTDHAHARRRQEEERTQQDEEIDMGFDADSDDAPAEAEEELALDFLGDVNADDMRSLLADHAPAATSATTASVASAAEATEAIPPVVAAALSPLSMPVHLLSTANAATVNTTGMAGASVGVSMGEDTGVSELMDELHIDVQSLVASTTTTTTTAAKSRPCDCGATANEQKTEESTPPRHVREQRVQRKDEDVACEKRSSPSAKKVIGGAMETAWKDVFDPETAAADEMAKWVTGKNAPEVVKRLETLQGENKRKNTKRFGTNTYLEQATIRRVAKYHAGEGDGSSSSSSAGEKSDSDFEIIEVEEEEDEEEAVDDEESFSDTELREEERRKTPSAKRRIQQRPRTKMTIKKSAPSTKARSPKNKRTPRIVLEESDDEEASGRGDTAKSTERVREEDEKEMPRPAEKKAPRHHEEPQAIDLISESEAEAEPDTHEDVNANTSSVKDKLVFVKDKRVFESEKESTSVDETATTPRTSQCSGHVKGRPVFEFEKQSTSVDETVTTDMLKVSTASLQERIEDTQGEVSMVCEPTAETLKKTPVELEHHTQPTDDAHGDHGYEVDDSDYGSGDESYGSDTGTIDLENEEMLARLAEESTGSPTSTTPSVANDVLNPVEPQVKMSPQHTAPPPSARSLQPDSPTTHQKSDAAPADPETVTFEEVSSDVDFGSGESADFGGDDDVAAVVAAGGDDDDDETEFTQFFVSSRGTQVSAKSGSSKPSLQTEAMPAQKVHSEEPPSASAPLVGNTKQRSLAASSVMEKGSNGLRTVPNINTTTVKKGRYKQTRKAIRLLDEDMNVTNLEPRVHDPKAVMIKRSRLLFPAAPPAVGEVSPNTIRPLHLRRSHSEDRGKAGVSERYLNYNRAASQPRGPSIKETFVTAAKQARERYDKKTGRSTPTSQTPLGASKPVLTFEATAVGTGAGVLKPLEGSMTSDGVYLPPRERQLDVYQATGAISQFDDDEPLSLSMNHKRPSKFVKETEKAKLSGIDVRKGKPEELDPRAKIPKKSAQQLAQERTAERERQASHAVTKGGKRDGDMPRRKDAKDSAVSPSKPKRAKTTNAKAESNGASFKYRPSSGPPSSSSKSHDSNKRAKTSKHDTSSSRPSIYGPSPSSASSHDSSRQRKDDVARHHGSSSVDSKKRRRSPSPPHKSQRDRDRESSNRDERDHGSGRGARDDEWNRGRDRDRDGKRDYPRHDRSRSPSDSRHRSRHSHSPSQSHSSRSHLQRRSRSRSRSPARVAPRDERRHRDDRREDRWSHDRWSLDDPHRSTPSYVVAEDLARSMTSGHDGGKEPRVNPTPREETTEPSQNEKKAAVQAPIENEEDSDIAASDIEFVDDFDDEPGANMKPDIRVKLSDIQIDDELRARMVYVSNVPPQLDEEHITEMFRKYGIAKNHAMGIPAVEVFLCQRSHRPRGDARITFVTPEAAANAASDMNSHISGNTKVFVREMDKNTMRVLHAQFDTFRDTWICPNADCRAESSTWTRLCNTCNHHRVFPPSNVKVHSGDWLCSICFATNAEMSSKCSCCGALLPLLPQEKAYHKQATTSRHDRHY